MLKQNWQITEPFSAVIFDCDGTLTAIEGIDYLAQLRGVYTQVASLTEQAMAKTGLTPALYEQRLDLVQPSQADVLRLGVEYCHSLMPYIAQVITALQALNKAVYIISAGLKPAVNSLAAHLSIPSDRVKAVDIFFDDKQDYHSFDLQSPLVHNDGKKNFVKDIQKLYPRILYIGDGLNDLSVRNDVSRFVGFGGAFYRNHIAEKSDFYITDYATLLPLALTDIESKQLDHSMSALYQQGLSILKS